MRFYKAFFAAALLVGCIYAAPSDINSADGGNSGTKSPANSANSANFGTQSVNSATQGVNSSIKSTNLVAQSPVNSANFADSTATGGI